MIRHADVIYTAEGAHAEWIRRTDPDSAGKIHPLAADGGDVPDPYGGSPEDYREVAARIANALELIVERTLTQSGLLPGTPGPG
jgi:protein-tyrosine-phosphatase